VALNLADGGGGILGQDEQNVFCANHVQGQLHRGALIGSLKEYWGNGIAGGAMTQVLQAFRGPDAANDQNSSIPPQKSANLG
jgi:hypothetical protein